jgi:hypothetical protein
VITLVVLKLGMTAYVQEKLEVCGINKALKEDCERITGQKMNKSGTTIVLIDQIWEELKKSHRLRIVK